MNLESIIGIIKAQDTEPSEMYFENATIIKNIVKQIRNTFGAQNKSTEANDKPPLPPLNLNHTGHM